MQCICASPLVLRSQSILPSGKMGLAPDEPKHVLKAKARLASVLFLFHICSSPQSLWSGFLLSTSQGTLFFSWSSDMTGVA